MNDIRELRMAVLTGVGVCTEILMLTMPPRYHPAFTINSTIRMVFVTILIGQIYWTIRIVEYSPNNIRITRVTSSVVLMH
jgi:hypothetical protein